MYCIWLAHIFKRSNILATRKQKMASTSRPARLGITLEDHVDGALVMSVQNFAVIEGSSVQKGDVILKINGFDATKGRWRSLLQCGAANSPFKLQFRSQAFKSVSFCVIYKQMVDVVPANNKTPVRCRSQLVEQTCHAVPLIFFAATVRFDASGDRPAVPHEPGSSPCCLKCYSSEQSRKNGCMCSCGHR